MNKPDGGYSTEFRLLKEFSKTLREDKANLQEGEEEYNARKNRYKDILPFAHTRVVLSSDPQVPGSDYINANYIRGPSGSPRAYIACQGPLSCTLADFWRMIWECNVSVIIMACNEIESDKPKCEIYWPEQVNTSQYYDNIQVTLLKVRQICPDFLIRKFSVRLLQSQPDQSGQSQNEQSETNNCSSSSINTSSSSSNASSNNINNNNNHSVDLNDQNNPNAEQLKPASKATRRKGVLLERTICQFHYTTWPDHGVPKSGKPILDLVRLVREVQPSDDQPILVHCSAGCGRTGTICCIDYVWGLLRLGKLDANFDLCNIISEMRQQRVVMVQTLAQYILCHRVVAALFINQLKLIDDHTYQNLDSLEDGDDDEKIIANDQLMEEQDLGPVFI